MSLYKQIEKSFFFTLTRKIVGNVSFLVILNLLTLWMVYSNVSETKALLSSKAFTSSTASQVATLQDAHLAFIVVIAVIQLLVGVAMVFFMRALFLKPIKAMTHILSSITEKAGDISATLPTYTHDEISEMAESYNHFSKSLRSIIDKIRRRSVNVAVGSTNLHKMIVGAHERVSRQEERASQVFASSSEATKAIDEIAMHTTSISDQNTSNLEDARTSSSDLSNAAQQVEQVNTLLHGFNDTVNQLSQNSENIRNILTLVQEFSDQTNLLALNAAIEAARAGENGRGFAVVADEVRNLSHKVNEATGEISKNISEMSSLVETTKKGTQDIQSYTENTQVVISATSTHFEKMVQDFETVNEQLINISSAIEELSITNKESHRNVSEIADLSKEISSEMDNSQQFSDDLEVSTEQTQELLSRFIIGYGGFENMIVTAREWREEMQNVLTELSDKGLNLFDTHYQAVPNTNPQKYTVPYMQAYEKAVQPVMDSFVKARSEFIYAVAVDKNGYLPAHHAHLSKPMTGDFETDNLHSRHQKIYNANRAEVRRAENTESFLLQTYVRDTGQVLNDLSFPLYVKGKHWGGFILGFKPEQLLEKG